MDELSEDQLRELEEQLYSQVHHQGSMQTTLPDVSEEEETQTANAKFLSNRYWVNCNESKKTPQKQKEKPKGNVKGPAEQSVAEKQKIHTQSKTQKVKERKKDHKVLNPFSPISKHRQQTSNAWNTQCIKVEGAPFGRQAQKLERAIQYENKKQKSKNARLTMAKTIKVTETVVLDSSDDNDDVIVVPLPPQPIFNVDESDDDEEITKSDPAIEKSSPHKTATDAFITPKSKKSPAATAANELASDTASRSNSPNSVVSQDDFIVQNDQKRLLKSATIADDTDLLILTNNTDSLLEPPSPARFQRNEEGNSNEIECIGTFIKPTTAGLSSTPQSSKKKSYRVDQSGLQAMDVYESESDIVSDGIYTKGMAKSQPHTTIRKIRSDNSSGSEIDATTPIHAKTKRLRKRRASESFKGSESNGCYESSDTDEDDGVATTCVPFISRGPAVESCKSKRFKKRTASVTSGQGSRSDQMPDSEFIATLNSLAQGSDNNEVMRASNDDSDSEVEKFPSARDIAETVINQTQVAPSTQDQPQEDSDTEKDEEGDVELPVETVDEKSMQASKTCDESDPKSDEEGEVELSAEIVDERSVPARKTCDDAIPPQIGDGIERLFEKLNEISMKKAIELRKEDPCDVSLDSNIDPVSDVSTEVIAESNPVQQEADQDSKIKYFISYGPANPRCLSDGFGWNEEMRRFYNNSWGGENVKIQDILRHMNRDRRLWTIMDEDRMLFYNRRDFREKCVNCFSFGHTRARCPKPRKPVMCYMCGESGHTEARCPHTRCLRCGSKAAVFSQSCKKCLNWNNRICPICTLRGHSLNDCPDKWRRYHSTTIPNDYPNSRVVYNKRRYCCYCGKKGHLLDECKKAMYRLEYPKISSEIKSHEKSYDDTAVRSSHKREIPCRLLYDPNVRYDFGLTEKATHSNTYGRFLCAVGLGHLIGVKGERKKPFPFEETMDQTNKSAELEQPSCSNISPEQVPEISESTSEATQQENSESLKMPPPRPPSQTATTAATIEAPIDQDSDSNYSFSDHFEIPTTSTQRVKTAPLPDFISLKNTGQEKFKEPQEDSLQTLKQLDSNNMPKLGISAKYVEYFSDEMDAPIPPKWPVADNATGGIPCEAKIYISNEHSIYFQSGPGQEYLNQIMIDNHLKGRLNKTIVGYALFIHGLPANQEKLQRELDIKFKSLNEEKNRQSAIYSKVPRNVNVLIQFLRDNINQLYRDLGNASELYKQLIDLDKNNSKASMKSADRIRKTLNMIFLGQAGLYDGDKHIETLLDGISMLINNFKKSDKIPKHLRNKIEFSWRMLFTSYRHKDYSQLLLEYLKIPPGSRNRLSKRKIEPSIMGKAQFNINVKEQKAYSNDYTKQFKNSKKVEDSTLLLNVISAEKNQQLNNDELISKDKLKNEENQKTTDKKQQIDEKKTTIADKFNGKQCQYLLSEIAKSPNSGEKTHTSVSKDSKLPSLFWSRESQRFLKELIESASDKPSTLERLQRINMKANAGGLSYNDYRSVIELYNVTTKIAKK